VHRTHSSPHIVTRHRREYWVGISCRAVPAVVYLIVAWNVFFHVFNGQRAWSSRAGNGVGPRWALMTIYTCQTTSIYLVPFVVPVYRRRSACMLLVGGSDIGTIHPREGRTCRCLITHWTDVVLL